jgi:hypothetical protein
MVEIVNEELSPAVTELANRFGLTHFDSSPGATGAPDDAATKSAE